MVMSVPAPQTSDVGLEIAFPSFEYGKVKTAFEFPFHIYSLETGLAVTTGVNCTLHIYDAVGNHLLVANDVTPSHTYDYEFNINNKTFNTSGQYSFDVYCRCATCGSGNVPLGGYVKHIFTITDDGRSTENNWFYFGLLLGLMFVAWTLIKISETLDEEHKLLKILFSIVALIIAVSGVIISFTTITNSFLSVAIENNALTIYKLVMWTFRLFALYLLVYLIWKALKWLSGAINK